MKLDAKGATGKQAVCKFYKEEKMLIEQIKKAFMPKIASAPQLPRPGLRHYEREVKDTQVRYHLRVDTDGSGILIANAAAVCRLSPTGVVISEGLLENTSENAIRKRIAKLFTNVESTVVDKDIDEVKRTIEDMAFPGSKYPLFNLDDTGATARKRALAAPLSAELSMDGTGDPRARIDKLWEVAAPQVVLIHLPGADGKRIVESVERAEDHGLIAGVRATGSAFLENNLLDQLAQAGLDHGDIYWAGADGAHHDSLFGEGDHESAKKVFLKCRELELCPVAVVPVVSGSIERIEATLESLQEHGVNAVTMFAIAEEEEIEPSGGVKAGALRQALVTAEELCDRLHINLVFAPPVERDPSEPLEVQVRRGPRAAGEASIRVEPDGSVIPPHGPPDSVGNILTQPFGEIWKHEAFKHLRESVTEPEPCEECPGLVSCMTGCPVDPAIWARLGTPEKGSAEE